MLKKLYEECLWTYAMAVAGGMMLATIAGYVNAVMLGMLNVPVSHMSGAVSHLSMDVVMGNGRGVGQGTAIVAAFITGAAISGAVIGGRRLRIGRAYGLVLIGEGLVLLTAGEMAMRGWISAASITAALACGLQNAMASSFHGQVVRTTHVTGIVTDLGAMIGHLFRRHPVHLADVVLLASLLVGFFVGGCVGLVMEQRQGVGAVTLAAWPCLIAGTGYFLWRIHRRRRIYSAGR